MSATKIPITNSNKILTGSTTPLTGEQNESFLGNKNPLGNEIFGDEESCLTTTQIKQVQRKSAEKFQ